MLRPVHSWQVLLADLSLILFITTAATVAQSGDETLPLAASGDVLPAAVYRIGDGSDSPDQMREWIKSYTPDPRESLEIVIRYQPEHFAEALTRARGLMEQAQASGHDPRITFEVAAEEAITASFGFTGNPAMARKLLNTPIS